MIVGTKKGFNLSAILRDMKKFTAKKIMFITKLKC